MATVIELLVSVLMIVAMWKVYVKMGCGGWEVLVPLYSTFVLCKCLFGNGWKMLLLLIPLYNIYFAIKIYAVLGRSFGKSGGFVVGMLFLPVVFVPILGFGDAQYAAVA